MASAIMLSTFFFCSIVLLIGESSALFFRKIKDLGTKNNITSTKVEISGLNLQFTAVAHQHFSEDIPECEKFVVLWMDDVGLKMRSKPKGNCESCCKARPGDVKLLLFSKKRPKKPFVLPHVRRANSRYRNLNNRTKVIVYIHGFSEISEKGSACDLKDAYISRKEPYSVIVVDWSELVGFPWYDEAIANVKRLAKVLTRFLETYVDAGVIDIRKVHLIGFSLGAHVAGFVGKFLRKNLRIPRITALDPAYPRFNSAPQDEKLHEDDADFVDVIHTDGGNFGFISSMGHADFYPNGGTFYQPGCSLQDLQKTNKIYDAFSCSHQRAHKFYVESVYSPYNFPGVKCHVGDEDGKRICNISNIAYMGYATEPSASGSYFLKTNLNAPYGRSSFDIHSNEDW